MSCKKERHTSRHSLVSLSRPLQGLACWSVAVFKLSGLRVYVKTGLAGELVWASVVGPVIGGAAGDRCWGAGGGVGALPPRPHTHGAA